MSLVKLVFESAKHAPSAARQAGGVLARVMGQHKGKVFWGATTAAQAGRVLSSYYKGLSMGSKNLSELLGAKKALSAAKAAKGIEAATKASEKLAVAKSKAMVKQPKTLNIKHTIRSKQGDGERDLRDLILKRLEKH